MYLLEAVVKVVVNHDSQPQSIFHYTFRLFLEQPLLIPLFVALQNQRKYRCPRYGYGSSREHESMP